MKRLRVAAALLGVLACSSSSPSGLGAGVREVGTIPNPPGAGGRDGGYSVHFGGHSVWIFGDTFFAQAAADGYHWRASTWSYTDDTDASDGLQGWTHGLGADGKPAQLLPHTSDEQAFDDAHNGDPCPAGNDCGARHTLWGGPAVVDPASGLAYVFYEREDTEPTGSYAFTGNGSSVAIWPSPDAPAQRASVVTGSAADPTVLFSASEPPFSAGAVLDAGSAYVYACPGGHLTSPCRVARVAPAQLLDRRAWQFWGGTSWTADLGAAASVFDGAPLISVHYSPYLQKFVTFYVVPLTTHLVLRTAPRPEGPWSGEHSLGEGGPALDGTWDYGLLAHPELAREGGAVEYLSYFQPGKFLDGVIHLLEVRYADAGVTP